MVYVCRYLCRGIWEVRVGCFVVFCGMRDLRAGCLGLVDGMGWDGDGDGDWGNGRWVHICEITTVFVFGLACLFMMWAFVVWMGWGFGVVSGELRVSEGWVYVLGVVGWTGEVGEVVDGSWVGC